jgi:hypothetical protein
LPGSEQPDSHIVAISDEASAERRIIPLG